MNIDPVQDPMSSYRALGNVGNPYKITNPEVGQTASKIAVEKAANDTRVNQAKSPYANISQTVNRTMSQLNTDQRTYILEQYTRTDSILDKLGYYR
jgi:hypothetical protein